MKAVFLYSRLTGNSSFLRQLDYIEKELKKRFSLLTMKECKTLDELKNASLDACQNYDYLIFTGGDGTLNAIINFIALAPHKPILGYIPGGTANDFAKNFRLRKNVKAAVKNILTGEVAPFDICQVNDRYFAYVLATGVFSEISYSVKQSAKRKVGNIAYHLRAIKDAFQPHNLSGTIVCNGNTYQIKTPFLLILNSNHVGGFYVNLRNKMNDGKFYIFATKPGLFNGLLHYVFFKIRTLKIVTDEFTFKFDGNPEAWCLDGEMAQLNNVHVKCLHSYLQLIVPHRIAKRLKKQGL